MNSGRRSVLRTGLACAAMGLTGVLSACGFSPVYGTGSSADGYEASEDLAATKIGIIADREGQILHNFLLDRFNPSGRPIQSKYTLQSEIAIDTVDLGTQLDATTTRARVTVAVASRLTAFGETHSFRSRAVASYSTSESDYAVVVAEQDAIERSLRVIADDLRLQISTFFEKRRLVQG